MDLYYDRKSIASDTQSVVLEKAIQDLEFAEKLGLSDFRIDLFRAGILERQKKYEEALAEINIAIDVNVTKLQRLYFIY